MSAEWLWSCVIVFESWFFAAKRRRTELVLFFRLRSSFLFCHCALYATQRNARSPNLRHCARLATWRHTSYVLGRIAALCGLLRQTDGVAVSVGRSVTTVNSARTAEPIEMPFGMWTRVVSGNHALDGGPDSRTAMGNFGGEKGLTQDMPGHARRSIYSKRLGRGQHRYAADADWGVLDWDCTLLPFGEYDWTVRVRRRCGHVTLLWPLVSNGKAHYPNRD